MDILITLTDSTGQTFDIAVSSISLMYDDKDDMGTDSKTKILFKGGEGGVRVKQTRSEIRKLVENAKLNDPLYQVLTRIESSLDNLP